MCRFSKGRGIGWTSVGWFVYLLRQDLVGRDHLDGRLVSLVDSTGSGFLGTVNVLVILIICTVKFGNSKPYKQCIVFD